MDSRISLIPIALLTIALHTELYAEPRSSSPNCFYHIVTEEEWELSQSSAEVLVSKEEDRSILLITEQELAFQMDDFHQKEGMVILKIDPSRLYGTLRKGPGPVKHRLADGCIPLDAVQDVVMR